MRHVVKPNMRAVLGATLFATSFSLAGCAPQTTTLANDVVLNKDVTNKDVSSTAVSRDAVSAVPPPPQNIVPPQFTSKHNASLPLDATRRVRLGKTLAQVRFTDVNGTEYSNEELRDAPSVWVFVDVTCPCVKAYKTRLQRLQKAFAPRGVRFVYVFSQTDETLAQAKNFASQQGYKGIVVRDANQKLLQVFNAQCTTEAFLFDRAGTLRYHGRIDESTYAPQTVKQHDLKNAIEAVLQNRPVKKPETRAYACAISRLENSRGRNKTIQIKTNI